jgi:dihydrofolate reductase
MTKLAAFLFTSLDGYYEGPEPWSLDWHNTDEEFNQFAIEQLDGTGALVFGRATYAGMAQYWSSKEAVETDPEVASRMNDAPKVVVSRTIEPDDVSWANTRLLRDSADLAALKSESGNELLVLGSSVLAASLMELGLLDELRIMVNPVLLGAGNSLSSTLKARISLRLLRTRTFGNGNVMLVYEPQK